MDIIEQKRAAEQFVKDWMARGDEKQDTQNYWNQLLRTVYGVSVPEQYIAYEKPVAKGFIDAYIADTRVLIEQKGMIELFLMPMGLKEHLHILQKPLVLHIPLQR